MASLALAAAVAALALVLVGRPQGVRAGRVDDRLPRAAALTDGVRTDAARTDAARTDAARTDAARTDGAAVGPSSSGVPGAVPAGVTAVPAATSVAPPAPTAVVAHAAGAVRRPGVYRLGPAARVGDLVTAAGGPAEGADLDRVNLAALLTDGTRVYVPPKGQPDVVALADPVSVASSPPAKSKNAGPAAPLDLNTASAEELQALPGVGPATAAAIIDHRQRIGRFRSVTQLLDVRGIGNAKLAALRPHLRV